MQVENKYQRGQVMVLLVISIVVLLGFTALAIDGGMVYADRRHAQSGADASSLAGGGAAAQYLENAFYDYDAWGCTDPQVTNARILAIAWAIQRALDNDYVIDDSITDVNGVETVCGIEDRGGWFDKYIDVHTAITRETETNFAHLIYGGPLRNEVQSITRIRPRTSLGFGNAIVALREDCPNSNTGGVHFDGTSSVIIDGGGIYSNACIRAVGVPTINLDPDQSITCVGEDCATENPEGILGQDVIEGTTLPLYVIEIPEPEACNNPPLGTTYIKHSGSGTLDPGYYERIRVNSENDVVVMNKGLYCVEEDFVINGGSVTGEGVTIFIRNGNFASSGNATIILSAPAYEQECDPITGKICPPGIKGLLLYLAPGNTGSVSLLGDGTSTYTGTVYAPDGMIEAGGTSMQTLYTQLIGDTIFIHGTTDLNIIFDEDNVYPVPTMLELNR